MKAVWQVPLYLIIGPHVTFDPRPSRAPKVFQPVFLQLEILEETAGAGGAKNFFAS